MGQIPAFRSPPPPPAGAPATWAAVPPMSLYLFRLVGRRQFALTCDPTGRNIPAGYRNGAWRYVRRVQVLAHEVRLDFDPGAVASAIASDGYALVGCPFAVD